MAFWDKWFNSDPEPITEATKVFKGKGNDNVSDKFIESTSGEGVDDVMYLGFGRETAGGFNRFYNDFINTTFTNKRLRINNYRIMSEMPEISSVIEDITIESTQEDYFGKILKLEIVDNDILENENIVNNLTDEFDTLFHRSIRINDVIIDFFRTYFVDGEIYLEKVIQKGKSNTRGIINLKKLPTETMDCYVNPTTGKVEWYYQALAVDVKAPKSLEEALKDDKLIVFYPEQITHMDYGVYQGSRRNVLGYLEKAKQPFNQLKLLETSVVIYRIVKAPERLVFKIDTGAMPRDKSLKFVEKIKKNLSQKVEFDTKSGTMRNQTDVMSMMDNYFLPQSSDGRGSSIESIGGDPSGFAQLDDIYYFARKLYIALKYPISRVINAEERRQGDTLFMGGNTSEITIDEIRWAKFLERHQQKFSQAFTNIFLLHLEFKGLKAEYDIDIDKVNVTMTPPNDYKAQMHQMLLESQISNYQSLSGSEEFSKTFLMREFLKWDDERIKQNSDGFKEDEKYFPKSEF